MKYCVKITALVLLVALLLPYAIFSASATTEHDVIQFEDGSYITIEITGMDTRSASTKTAKKTYRYHNNDGVEEWKAVLNGTFSYNGTSSTCTASSCTVSITNTAWYVISKTATKSSNMAYANLTMGKKVLGIVTDRKSISMKLTCDKNGNLS